MQLAQVGLEQKEAELSRVDAQLEMLAKQIGERMKRPPCAPEKVSRPLVSPPVSKGKGADIQISAGIAKSIYSN